ncbi:diguanylate cyclase [Kutzneria sp. CA-103260]|nr:diguanylate cyclase [Kutzneria sp. CA-103260]
MVRTLIAAPWRWARSWALWQAPRHVVAYVLAVEVIAVATTVGTAGLMQIRGTDLIYAGMLCAGAWLHIEGVRPTERQRERGAGAGPYLDTKAVWSVAAALILPPLLASAVVVVTYTIAWLRIWPRRQRPLDLFRWVFSAATILLGTQAAIAVLALGLPTYPGLPRPTWAGFADLAVIAAAFGLRWLLNYGLVVAAILVSSPNTRLAKVLENFHEQSQEIGAYAFGLLAAALAVTNPPLLLAVVVGVVAVHRGLLLHQFRTASRTDSKTGFHTLEWWFQAARQALDRARVHGSGLAVLIADLDHFKQVNDTYGHVGGDRALEAVARALRTEVRDYDIVGRWGGEEFVVLLLDVDERQTRAIAERIRERVHSLKVILEPAGDSPPRTITDLTISIGATLIPHDSADTLDEAIRAADAALYAVKEAGRNRVKLTYLMPPRHPDA